MADEIRLPVSADTTQMERNIADAARRVGTINLNANIDSRGIESLVRPLGKITGQADEFSKSMEAANARVLAFGASVGVINALSNAFKGLVSSTVEVEKSLTEIKIIGNETFSNLNKTSAGLFATAKQLGVSYKDAADATLEFARQGKGLTESLNASKAALALTRTAGISATEAVMGLTSAVNAFGRGADAYIEYANKMSAVSDAFAVNNKDLIEGMSRSASVAQEAGVSFEQLTALITTLQEKTGRGGAVIGNALKTIFTRVKNPEIIKDLEDLGVSIQDTATGSFLPATQILQNLANEFQKFDKNIRNNILLKVGGGFQVDKLAALLNDIKDSSGTFQRSFQMAGSGNGDILGRVAKLNQTLDSSFTNILTSSKQLGANIGQIAFSKDFTNILQNGASLISSLNDAIFGDAGDAEDQGSAIGKAVLKGLGSVISGPGLFALFGIFAKLSVDFAKFSTEGVKTLIGITSKSKEEQLIQAAISKTLSENTRFQNQILSLEGNRVAQAELLLGVIRQQVNESKKLEDISKNAASALYGRGVRLSGGNPQIVGSATNSAKGYIPNLADAIAKEKSESPAGSRIIVDRNFPMGGGERSTMVYNSNETRIKNFAGTGGDAIIPNYPINSAKGFVPNFAKKEKKVAQNDGRKSLEVDAANLSVAGLTFAGENKGFIKRAKPVPIDEDLLAKYSGSPYVKVLEQFKNFTLTNVPVGNVYRLRKGLQQSEDEIKADFLQKLNSKFREQTISFLLEEINGLGLPTGGGVGKNLSNLKLNVIGSSTAGYIFEEILKIPTLSDAEKVAQYASQSDTDFFDIKNLSPEFSEAYGLPKKGYDLVELKFGERELKDGISKKFLNQLVAEGGGANPKKFGQKDTNRAARGYIPNFAESISSLKSRMKASSQKGSGYLQNYYDVDNQGFNDSYDGNVEIKYYSLDKSLDQYALEAKKELNKVRKKGNSKDSKRRLDDFKRRLDPFLGNSFVYETMFNESEDSTRGTLNNIQGALAERDFAKKFKDFTPENDELAGIDFYKGNQLVEIKARDKQFSKNEANAKVLAFLGSKQPKKNNEINDIIDLSKVDFSLYETYKTANRKKYLNAAKGYIPNFSELTGTGAGMLYQDPNFNELGGGQSGKFLAPKSGEGFGQKIFYKTGSDKINQEYQVNKSIKDFEKQNPALFAKNAISFTNVGKLLTKNGLAAGFEREVVGGLGVDEFATGTFSKGGAISPKTNFAFYLSELLAQSGVKNVVGEYRKIYGPDSLRIDDIYAQNFKVNDIMQKMLIEETNQFFKGKKKVTDSDVNNYIGSLNGNPLINSLNEKFGAAGGRHTMFDTQGFAKNASKGYIPNFANVNADILTVNPAVAKMSVDQFIEKYLGSQYSTGLSGTSANALKITGSPQQMMEAKRDFIMSMLGPNFLATYERNEKANNSRAALIRQKSKSTGTRVKKQGGFMRAYGDYAQTDLSAALEGTFSGNAKKLNYEDLDTKAEKIFQQNNLTQYWNEIVKTMQLVGEAYRSESVSANNTGRKMDFDYSRIEVPEEGKFKYGLQQTYKAKEKIRELTALIRPKLIEGLLEGEKGVQGLVLNQPEYDKEGGVEGDYLVLLDAKAAQLKKLVSDYLINPDLDPLQIGSPEQSENKFRIREIIDALDGPFGSGSAGKGIFLDELKQFRNYSKGNPQLQKFFMDGEDKPGAFLVQKASQGGRLGAFLKPDLPQSIIEKIATVLAASYNRDGIFQLSNLDVGYAGQLSYAGSKNNPLLDTFATSPQSATSIPSTVKYGDYKNNKAYYDSIAKWKYDANSKSMVRQAAKGYIPNFAGGGIINSLKDKAKKIIKNPIAQSLFDQAIETLLGLPEGFESSEIIKQINFALTQPNPQMELAKVKRKKRSENRQAKIRDYLSRNASSAFDGYIPNFAKDALEDAVIREQLQSGLPSSQISLTRDSRLANNLNPSGFAVINKRDEPNGKVPTNRIADAYKNAGRGFIPNFSTSESQRAEAIFNRTEGLGGTVPEESRKAVQENIKSSKKISTSQDKLVDKIINYIAAIAKNTDQEQKMLSAASKYTSILDNATKLNEKLIQKISRSINAAGGLTSTQDSQNLQNIIRSSINSPISTASSGSEASAIVNAIREGFRTVSDKQNERNKDRGKNTEEKKDSPEQENKPKEKEKKQFAEIAARMFIFQSALSFTSGALSSFGGSMQQIGEIVNDAGSALISFTQAGDIASQIRGEGNSEVRNFAGNAFMAAGVAYGVIQLVGAFDKAFLTFNGTLKNSKAFVDDLEVSFSKYNIQLSEQSKKIGENISKYGSVSGAGAGSFLSREGLSYQALFGNKDIANMQKTLGFTGLSEGANQDITVKASQFIASQISAQKGGEISSKELQELTQKKIAEDFEKMRQESSGPKFRNTDFVERINTRRQLISEEKGKDNPDFKKITKYVNEINELRKEGIIYEVDQNKLQEKINKYLKDNVVKTQDATVAEQARKEALLFSSDLLKQQLNSYQQISKIQLSIPSLAENQLSVEKELLTTTEARRMEIDRSIKSLSEQRQLTSEIKDTALTFGRERVEKYLGQISGSLQLRGNLADDIRGAFTSLAGATDEKSATAGVQNVLSKLRSREGADETDQEKENRRNAVQFLEQQLIVVKANSKAREYQNSMEAQNLAYIKQQNYEYNVRKEAINTQLTLEQRSLDIAKERLSLTRRKEDTQFETSLIGTMSPLQAEKARILRDIQNLQTRPKQDLKTEEAGYAIARKQAIANLLNEKNVRPETVQSILNQSGDQQIKSITDQLNKERNGFAQQVKDSGEAFYLKIFDSAELLSDAISKSAGAPEKSIADRLDSIGDLNRTPTSILEKFKEKLSEQRESLLSDSNITEQFDVLNQELDKVSKSEEKINKILEDRKGKEYEAGEFTTKNIEDIINARAQKPVLSKETGDLNKAELEKRLAELKQYNQKFTFKGGMQEAQFQLTDEITTFENKLGKEIPMSFRDSMVSAMKELSNPNSTQPLKERLLGVANAFLQKINEAFMTQAANKLTSSIMGSPTGMASGGYIKGGSGSKDDVPAMLMGGEYVVTKSAVQKYGPSFFDALNKGTIKKYASGGWVESDVTKYQDPAKINPYGQNRDKGLSFNESGQVIGMDSYSGKAENKQDAMMKAQTNYYAQNAQTGQGGFYMPGQNGMGGIMGARNLLAFATQQTTGTKFDKISSRGGAASIDIGAGSSNLSLFALRDQDNIRNQEYLQAKQKSSELYFGSLDAAKEKANKEEEIRKEQERLKQEQKTAFRKMYQGLIRQAAQSVLMAGIGQGMGSMGAGMSAAKQAAWQSGTSAGFMEGALSGGTINGETRGGLFNMFNSRGNMDFSNMVDTSGNFYKWNRANKTYSWQDSNAYNRAFPYSANYGSSPNSNGYYFPQRRASGGFVAGNGMGDNVPTMLNGGEFVVSRQAAQNIGANKLQQINSGNTGNDSSEIIAAKLDELVEKLSAVGTINITVNSDGKGGNQSREDESQNTDKQQKELARRIKDVVLGVLRDEKRLGGLLR